MQNGAAPLILWNAELSFTIFTIIAWDDLKKIFLNAALAAQYSNSAQNSLVRES